MSIWSRIFGKQAAVATTQVADVADAVIAKLRGKDGMANVLTAMGTPHDKRSGAFYKRPPNLRDVDLDNMYGGSWLAGKIIDIPVDDMTRMGWTRKWDGVDTDQDSVKKVADAETRFAIPSRVNRVAKWGRLYGEAYLVPIIRGQELHQPLVLDSIKQGMLLNFLELDCYDLTPHAAIDDRPDSANAGYPISYRWRNTGLEIHWSRLIKFGGRELPYRLKRQQQYRDDSILRRIVEVIMNYDGAEGGVASLILEAKVDILALKGLALELAEDDGDAKVQKRIQTALLMKSIWQTLVVDAGDGPEASGDRFDNKQVSFANLDKVLDRLGVSVAGAADIPVTRLFGMSPGGQNSTGDSDDDNYDDHVAAMRRTQLAPRLNQVDQVLIRSTLGKMPENYELSFPPLTQEDPREQAEIRKLDMETLTGYAVEGYIPDDLPIRQLKAWGTFSALEKKDVTAIQELADTPEEPEPDDEPEDEPADPKRDAA